MYNIKVARFNIFLCTHDIHIGKCYFIKVRLPVKPKIHKNTNFFNQNPNDLYGLEFY